LFKKKKKERKPKTLLPHVLALHSIPPLKAKEFSDEKKNKKNKKNNLKENSFKEK
jgi:beta-lactamase regulating signal transducer with metallopeptidase domain